MANYEIPAVGAFGELLQKMLARGKSIKHKNMVEPPMNKSDIVDLLGQFESIFSSANSIDLRKKAQYPIIETAVRDKFNNLLATTYIDTAEFVELWDLLDVISILSDEEECAPELLFWLVEELLDSQTIAGCRKVFDYLESRRERIVLKHFRSKSLIILRSCNELLRRLSRAEDTAFCGRVFIFLFQSFPLGDRSSVNLRGEYHTESVTTFDQPEPSPEKMDVDATAPQVEAVTDAAITPTGNNKVNGATDTVSKGVSFSKQPSAMTTDELYPIFWSMQEYFSQPKKLFEAANLTSFKHQLESTMAVFRVVQKKNMGPAKSSDDSKKGTKRKWATTDDELANLYNPKYLTSKDLFDLEVRDLVFRRNICLQVLIVIDFLLSLSTKGKDKFTKSPPEVPNRSVMYADYTLTDEDYNWATKTRTDISDYLRDPQYNSDGPFFHRMLETVLTRDKNWLRWKIESCPSISRDPVTPEAYSEVQEKARLVATSKRLKANPVGSLDLAFLSNGQSSSGLDELKSPSRYEVPSVKSFQAGIELDDMDIDMAMSDEAKNTALESKSSKSWRALRIAGASNLAGFDKIERADKIDEIFKDKVKSEDAANDEGDVTRIPKDKTPIVISGPSGVGKGTLISLLLEKHPKAFGKKASHTTRKPREGEVHGKHYFFVNKEEYNILLDGDDFLEFNNFNGNDYGTSRKVVQGIIAQGKVPIMEMDYHGIQQLKDNDFRARFIFLAPPDVAELEQRLTKRGTDTPEKIKERLEIAKEELKQSEVEGFHHKILINDDLDTTYKALEDYIFGEDAETEDDVTAAAEQSQDVPDAEMVDPATIEAPPIDTTEETKESKE